MDLANLEKMKVVDLRNELQTRGLDTKGVKAVLIERLRAHLEGGSGAVPPSPGTPSRRSRRTRSMTKSPSPSPIKKAPEPILETLEEEIISSNVEKALVDDETNIEEQFSAPEQFEIKILVPSPSEKMSDNKNNSHIEKNDEYGEKANEKDEKEEGHEKEEVHEKKEAHNREDHEKEKSHEKEETCEEKEARDEQTNGGEATIAESSDAVGPKCASENLERREISERDISQNKSVREETNNLVVKKCEKHQDNQDGSHQLSKAIKERSRSHSDDRRIRRNQSHSVSHSRSRSPLHKLKSRSRSQSRTRSRSPKRRSGAGSLKSPKEGEDTSTPEDEPTIEENQFALSWFDSDLHLRIDPVTFTSAKPMSHDIFALVWSGARTNYGVREGKVCFEVRLSEETNLNRDHPFRDEPYTKGFRVGFSISTSSLLLGESQNSFAYCESGRKATNGEFSDFSKPFQLDDVIGCYLDLESTPCTIKYTLNGEDLGVAFEFDKAILLENHALFPHVLTKGYEYEINLADNDNLLVNVERKIRKRRKIKEPEERKVESEKEEDNKKVDKPTEEKTNLEDQKERKTEEAKNVEHLRENDENQAQHDAEIAKSGEYESKASNENHEDVQMCEISKEEQKKNMIEEGDSNTNEDKENAEATDDIETVEKEHIEKENDDEKSTKDKDDSEPSPAKRPKIDTPEEDEYEEVHPEPRGHMSLLGEYELIALIPEEQYISGPQRPESRKDCEVILMVGLPGAGKTTWVLNHIKDNPDKRYHVVGADALISKMTIDGVPRKSVHKGRFERIYELCFNVLTSLEDIAVKRRRNFILDQANAYASAQRRKMKGFADFKRIAVVCIPNEEELKRRLADKKEKGHAYTLKESTLNTLQAAFTLPSLEFGWFDDIIFTDLGMEEAKEEVKKYNEKGKKALHEDNSSRHKRQRRDGYHDDGRRRQDDRRRYDNRNDSRWNDRRAGGGGGGGGYYHGGVGGGGNRWGGGGGYRNNSSVYRDDRGYGGGDGRGYDHRHQRFSGGPQNWVHNNRNRYDDRSNRYGNSGGGGGSGRYNSYGGGGSRDYRGGGGDRDHRDRNRGGNGGGGDSGGGGNNRRDCHRSNDSNQRDFRRGHRDTHEDSRGGSRTTSATATTSKPRSVASSNNGGNDKYNKNPQANNWSQYQQHQVGPAVGQQQQYWNYDMQGYGNQQQWQSMDPQQQQQWMSWWQQHGNTQHTADGGTSDPNQYWSQYSYNTSADVSKK